MASALGLLSAGRDLRGVGMGLMPLAIAVARDLLPAERIRSGISSLSITISAATLWLIRNRAVLAANATGLLMGIRTYSVLSLVNLYTRVSATAGDGFHLSLTRHRAPANADVPGQHRGQRPCLAAGLPDRAQRALSLGTLVIRVDLIFLVLLGDHTGLCPGWRWQSLGEAPPPSPSLRPRLHPSSALPPQLCCPATTPWQDFGAGADGFTPGPGSGRTVGETRADGLRPARLPSGVGDIGP